MFLGVLPAPWFDSTSRWVGSRAHSSVDIGLSWGAVITWSEMAALRLSVVFATCDAAVNSGSLCVPSC